jgi:hypothetical protein
MNQHHTDPLADLLAVRIAEVRRDIAQAEADTATLQTTLAEVQAVKVVRSDYQTREIYMLALPPSALPSGRCVMPFGRAPTYSPNMPH